MIKSLRLVFSFASLFLLGGPSFAQTTITIGTGVSNWYTYPLYFTYYTSSNLEAIYLQSEIGICGDITSIAFDKAAGASAGSITNVTIYMKHTTASTLASGTLDLTGYSQVFTGTVAYTSSNTWQTITLNTPFSYNGTDNLSMVIVKSAGTTNTSTYWSYTSTSTNYRMRYSTSSSTALTASYNRADIQLNITLNPNPGTVSASPTTVCSGFTTTLTTSGFTGGSTFQWQSSPNNSTWTNITGATSNPYVATVSANTYYRCVVTNGCSNNSGSVLVSIYTTPTTPTNNAETNVTCNSFDANWSSISGASSYRLDVSTVTTFASFVTGYQDLNVGNVTTYAVTGLNPNTNYYYRVRAVDPCGQTSTNAAYQSVLTLNTPAAPVNNAETNTTCSSFDANWTAISGVDHYMLDVSTSSTFASYVTGYQDLNVGNVTTYAVTGLSANTTYYYRARAVNACGQTSANGTAQTAPTSAPPTAPTNSAETNVLHTSFDANWTAISGATSYRLDVSTSSTFASFVTGYNGLNVGNVTTYAVTGLTCNTTYYYRARAVDACGQTSANAAAQTVLTRQCNDECSGAIPLTIGTSCVVTNGASNNASQSLAEINCGTIAADDDVWYSFVANCSNITITVARDATLLNYVPVAELRDGCSGTQLACVQNATSATISYTSLTVGNTYYIRTYDHTAASSGDFDICIYNPILSAPTNNAETNVTCSSFDANWSAIAGVNHYRLDVSTSSTFASYVAGYQDLNVGNVTTYAVTGLSPNTTYYYRARAVDACGQASANGTAQTAPTSAPAAALTNNAETNVTCSSFDANWSSAATATSYRLDVSTSSTFASYVTGYQDLNVGNVTTYAVTGLTANTTYYYRARAVDACGQTSANGTAQTAPTSAPPTAPTNSAETNVLHTSFDANWTAITGATSYRLDVSTSSTFASFVTGYNNLNVGNVTTYAVTGLTCNTTYYFRARAVDACGQTSANAAAQTVLTRQCNDECSGAIPLTIGTSCVVTNGASNNASQSLAAGSCAGTPDDDVWYSFVATCSNITISVTRDASLLNYSPVVELRDGCTGSSLSCVANATTATINYTSLTAGNTYYIRTFDNAAGGGDFDICIYNAALAAPTSTAATSITCSGFTANWNAVASASYYLLDVSTSSTFASFVTGYNGLNVGNVTTYNVTGLNATTTYYYRVRSVSVCGSISSNSSTQSAATITPSGNPTSATASSNPVCVGSPTNLSVTGGTLGTGASWKWYSGNICSGSATLVGTGTPLTVYPSATTTYYVRAEGTCNNTTCQSITVTTNPCYVQPPSSTSTTYTVCSGTFYDNGGTGVYSNSISNSIITFYPSTPGQVVRMTFSAFATYNSSDYLQIYNGNSTSAPLIGQYSSSTSPGTVTSCASDGSLTFKFTSDGLYNAAGWTAAISCVAPSAATAGTATASANSICSGSTVVLTLAGSSGLIQWQESTAGCGSYTDIAGATSASYTTPAITATKCFRAKVFCGSNVAYTTDVNVAVVPCYNHATTVASSYTVCAANYYDEGGAGANYANSRNITTTFYPSTPGQMIEVTFTSFSLDALSACPDYLEIYNGNSTSATLIDQYCQTNSPGTVTSCASDGSLTFRFVSNATTTQTGWSAVVSCVAPSSPVAGTAAAAAPTVCSGSSTNLTLTGYSGTVQWQSSTGGCATYTDIAGATSSTYTTSAITVTTCFRAKVSCGGTVTYSNIEVVAVTPCVSQPLSGSSSYTVCSGNYYDGGGPSANYGASQTSTLTLYPSTAGQGIEVSFSSFTLENSTGCANDYLEVYNGNSTAASLIGRYCAGTSPGTVTSCAADGSLTFKFVSNSTLSYAGWAGTISCVAMGSPTAGTASANPTTVCYGGTVLSLTGSSGTVQWQESPSGCASWTNIAGAVNSTYTVSTVAATKCYRAVVSCGGSSVNSNAVTVTYSTTFNTNTWTGAVNTDWNTAGNWTLGVPTSCHNVDIPNTTLDPILSSPAFVNNVTIQNGGVLRTDAALTIYGTFTIQNGGYYIHNNTANPKTTIFNGVESFGATSTFEVRNWEGTTSATFAFMHNGSVVEADAMHSTPFGNVVINWNKPSYQWEWHGKMTLSSNPRIAGDLTILQTGTNDIHLTEDGNQTHTLQNVTVSGGAIRFKGHEDGVVEGSSTLNINGNLTINGGTFSIEEDGELSSTYVNIVNITGNLNVSAGSLKFCDAEQRDNPSVHEFRVNGNMNFTGGTIYQSYWGTPLMQAIRFNGSATQYYTESGSIAARYFNYVIPTGKTLQLSSNMLTCLTTSGTLFPTVHITGTLIANNYKLYPSPVYSSYTRTGVKIFAGGRLKTTNANGFYMNGSAATTVYDANVATTPQTVVIDPLGYVEYNGTASQVITNEPVQTDNAGVVTPSRAYGILDINNTTSGGSALTMIGNVETDQLRLRDGIVSTGTDTLFVLNTTAGAAGSVQNHTSASYLNTGTSGALTRYVAATGSYDYPVGNANAYELMSLNITGGNTSTYISTNFSNPYNTTGMSILDGPTGTDNFDDVLNCGGINSTTGHTNDGVWIVHPNSGGTATYDFTAYATNYSNNGSLHTIVKRIDASNPWIDPMPGSYVAATGSNPLVVTRTGFTGFSHFAVGKSGVPLPVSLLSFEGRCAGGEVNLLWKTASEMNNSHFTIERSPDASNYQFIATVPGSGTSSTPRSYSIQDPDPMTDDTYYRLTQTDYNGNSETFSPVLIACADDLGFGFNINNNQLNGNSLQISVTGAKGEEVLFILTDQLGREIVSKLVVESSGQYLVSIDLQTQLAPGMYIVTASNQDQYISRKLIIR